MAHPMASQAKASQKRRLGKLSAKAGKSYGSSSMYKKTSYPSKNAGSSTPLTISGGSAPKRADRAPQKLAGGGFVGGSGGLGGGAKKPKKKGGSTTNIIIASPGGGAGAAPPRPVPIPVPRPVPVPVAAGGPAAAPPRPPMPPGAGAPPINVNVPPPAAAGPMPGGPPPMRPPGMADGGLAGSSYRNWGKGMANGGLAGSSYHNWGKGFADGGSVKKKANGGGLGPPAMSGRPQPPRKPFTPGAVPGVRPAAATGEPPVVPLTGGGRPTRPGYNKGGKIKGYADGEEVEPEPQASSTSVSDTGGGGGGKPAGGVLNALKGVAGALTPSASKGGVDPVKAAQASENAASKAAQAAAGSTQALGRPSQSAGFKPAPPPGAPGSTGKPMFKHGGNVKKGGAAGGLGRLAKISGARAVPAKTEI